MTTTGAEVLDVRLLQLPLDVLTRSQQHSDELQREFSHIASPMTDTDRVPDRLLALSQSVRAQFGAFTGPAMDEITVAQERGDDTIDVTFKVPAAAAGAAGALRAMWEEVDEFCRNGDLLTLATPPELVEFREWFLDQFSTQLNGGAPVPWPDYVGRATNR